jgi:hypothetical protein
MWIEKWEVETLGFACGYCMMFTKYGGEEVETWRSYGVGVVTNGEGRGEYKTVPTAWDIGLKFPGKDHGSH